MKRGISFEIPNEYGAFLRLILKPIDITAYNWYIGGEESYIVVDDKLQPLFPEEVFGMDGLLLRNTLEHDSQYLIFASLKAFSKSKDIIDVQTYEEFLNSECKFILLVIDSVYVALYCKDKDMLECLYSNAIMNEFSNLKYITEENDFRTRLSVW